MAPIERSTLPKFPPAGTQMQGPAGNPERKMTQMEIDTLTSLGIDVNQKLPDNLASIIQQVTAEEKADAAAPPLPVSPLTPAIQPEIRQLADMPRQEQQKYQSMIAETVQGFQENAAAQQAVPPISPKTQAIQDAINAHQEEAARLEAEHAAVGHLSPDVRDAYLGAQSYTTALAQEAPEPAATEPQEQMTFEDILQKQSEPELPAEEEEGAASAVDGQLKLCPHCGWDQAHGDDVELTAQEKETFLLTCVLGRKQYTETFSLYGGRVSVTLRTLTPGEVDSCYFALPALSDQGLPVLDMSSVQLLSEYRMAVSLLHVTGVGPSPMRFPGTLPDWQRLLPADASIPTITKAVKEWLGPSLFLALIRLTSRFNHKVNKLIANAENENFWT